MAALVVTFGPIRLLAQANTGAVTGLVRDSSGAAIPGATVRLVNEDTGVTLETISNEQGSYRAEGLARGQYRVETALDGFETAVRRIAIETGQTAAIDVTLAPARITEGVVVTARRIEEVAQEVPIPVSVVSGNLVTSAGAFNVNRLKELIPTVQFYSTNPRNSAINIRGLGAPFGLTNDGIEPIARRSLQARPPRGIWWSRATRCSTLESDSGGRMAGQSLSGPAICWTRTTSSCSRQRLATLASMWGSPETAEPSA